LYSEVLEQSYFLAQVAAAQAMLYTLSPTG